MFISIDKCRRFKPRLLEPIPDSYYWDFGSFKIAIKYDDKNDCWHIYRFSKHSIYFETKTNFSEAWNLYCRFGKSRSKVDKDVYKHLGY